MKFAYILVEGQTEETFVKEVLAAYFQEKHLFLTPVLVETSTSPSGKRHKGGISKYPKIRRDLERLLRDSNAACVSTMLDLYRLPADFPKYGSAPTGSVYQRVKYLEGAFLEDIGHPKFLPYLQVYEFEALLFAEPEQIAAQLQQPKLLADLQSVTNDVVSPEEINDQLPPSKRILSLYPAYDKRLDGSLIALAIGISQMRMRCPHFSQWLVQLEALA